MQALGWRVRRLLGMSPREVAWRAGGALRDVLDARRAARGRHPRPPRLDAGRRGFTVAALPVGAWARLDPGDPAAAWRDGLVRQADAARAHRLSFLGLEDRHLGDPIVWNQDAETGRPTPMGAAAFIDYRDYRVAGDIKMVWEPNRHHHLVVLARAFRATGEQAYAESLRDQLVSWLEQCPYGRGLNWRSPLELALRLINWVWALDLARDSGAFDPASQARVLQSAYAHLWTVTRRYSRGSSANNHRIGEAAGVFVAASYFDGFAESSAWRDEARDILCAEILQQTHRDGVAREQALGYHLFILEFFLLAALVAEKIGRPMPSGYLQRLAAMAEFVAALAEGGEPLPSFGDSDEGYVLDLGDREARARSLVGAAGVLLGDAGLVAAGGPARQRACWLFGAGAGASEGSPRPAAALAPRAFTDGGYYLLQCGRSGTADAVSVVFDCGELGFTRIAAHGHADALSFTLRAFGTDVLVDPGTYDYFRYPRWRDYFRGTRAHNTVCLDGQDQSVIHGPFLWGAHARARCLDWSPGPGRTTVTGDHDGYLRLADPVTHQRTLELDPAARVLTIRDHLVGTERHRAEVCFHFAEHCRVSASPDPSRLVVAAGGGTLALVLDPRLSATVRRGSEDPIGGWVSRGYRHKAPSATVIAATEWTGAVSLVCRIELGAPPDGAS
jgi:hypothetical protein